MFRIYAHPTNNTQYNDKIYVINNLRDELHNVTNGRHAAAGEQFLVTVQCIHLGEVRIADADNNDTQRRLGGSHQRCLR